MEKLLTLIEEDLLDVKEKLKDQVSLSEYSKGWWNGRFSVLVDMKKVIKELIAT